MTLSGRPTKEEKEKLTKKLLKLTSRKSGASAKEIAETLSITPIYTARLLRGLRQDGTVTLEGPRNAAIYKSAKAA